MADPTYNLNGGFKPTMKRFRRPRWAGFFSYTALGDIRSNRQRKIQRRHLGMRLR